MQEKTWESKKTHQTKGRGLFLQKKSNYKGKKFTKHAYVWGFGGEGGMKENHWLYQTKLLIQENGLSFVLDGLDQAVEELAMTPQEFEKYLIQSLLSEKEEPREQSDFTKSIQGKISISEVAVKRYGLKLIKKRTKCPFHRGAENPTSLVFYDKTNSFKCWSCGESGNLIYFIMLMERLK